MAFGGLLLALAVAATIALLLAVDKRDQSTVMSQDEYVKTRWAPQP